MTLGATFLIKPILEALTVSLSPPLVFKLALMSLTRKLPYVLAAK